MSATLPVGTADLVLAAQGGDEQALEALLLAHLGLVHAVCRRRLGARPEAEDAIQEALLRALRALPALREPERFGPWLARIAERVCQDVLRSCAATAPIELVVDLACTDTTPDDRAVERDEARRVRASLAALDERGRRALWLRDGLGAPVGDVAVDLGVTEGSARVLLTRARRRLREALAGLPCLVPGAPGLLARLQRRVAALRPLGEQVPLLAPVALAAALAIAPVPADARPAPAAPAVTAEEAAATLAPASPPAVAPPAPAPQPAPEAAPAPLPVEDRPAGGPAAAGGQPRPPVPSVVVADTPPAAPPAAEVRGGLDADPVVDVDVFAGNIPQELGQDGLALDARPPSVGVR